MLRTHLPSLGVMGKMQNVLGAVTFATLMVFSVVLVLTFSKKATGKFGYYLVILATYTGYAIALLIILGPFQSFADAAFYHENALVILNWWEGVGPNPFGGVWQTLMAKQAWSVLIATIYWFVGVQPAAVVFVNVLIVALTAVITASTIREIKPSFRPSWLFACFFIAAPFITIFAVSMGREALYWAGTALMMLASAKLLNRKWLWGFIIFVGSAVVLICLRPTLAIPQIFAFLIPLYVIWVISLLPITTRKLVRISLVGLVLALSIVPAKNLITVGAYDIDVTRTILSESATSGFDPDSFVSPEGSKSTAVEPSELEDASGDTGATSGNSLVDYVINSLQTLPRGLFGPFVTELKPSPVMVIAFINLIYWLLLLALTIIGLLKKWQPAHGGAALAIASLIIAVISSLLTNYGILIRFRAIALVIVMPYSFHVLSEMIRQVRSRRHELKPRV